MSPSINQTRPAIAHRLLHKAMIIACVCGGAAGIGCENVIPRRDLQLAAKVFPPSPPVAPEHVEAMTHTIRERSGVSEFQFTDSEFTPETRLPPGVEWIMGVFLGE